MTTVFLFNYAYSRAALAAHHSGVNKRIYTGFVGGCTLHPLVVRGVRKDDAKDGLRGDKTISPRTPRDLYLAWFL